MESFSINTASTLSVRFRPGEDTRIQTTKSESIFTFGDFRIFRDTASDTLSGDSRHLRFDSFSTLDSINGVAFLPEQKVWVKENELNFNRTNPQNYSYFGSFYTDTANAINSIIDNYPYAILSYNNNTGYTVTNHIESTGTTIYSTFRVPLTALTNQGNVIINSGTTITEKPNLYLDYDQFAIQFSGTSIHTNPVYKITNYNFINLSSSTSYLEFVIEGSLLGSIATNSTAPLYIRPSRERYNLYIKNLPSLERQIWIDKNIYIPNTDDDGQALHSPDWPKDIDGFNPDVSGVDFEEFKEHMLDHAAYIDEIKTNWIMRTMIPENYLDYDTEGEIYRKMIQVYAHEFDILKKYVDGIAYAHTVRYENTDEPHVPNKFLSKLAELLSWDLQGNFDESDLFEYLAGDIDAPSTTSLQANLIVWKKILSNIHWLYKKKGTRDALMFIFKLIGAPEEIVTFNEFVYRVNRTNNTIVNIKGYTGGINPAPITETIILPKVNTNGYVNYDESIYIFQEGGIGRGNGQAYINQWKPEFDPIKIIDNKKTTTGDTNFFGTENLINSKEVSIEFTASKAIESDVKYYYLTSGSCINNGFIDQTDLRMERCEVFTNSMYSSSTLSEYLEYIYSSGINPTNRKTIKFDSNNISFYPTLRKAYLNYYFNSTVPSRKLTIQKLETLLEKIGAKVSDYIFKLIPATTIFDSATVTYRNTIFDTPKFVYKEGINAGSEFRTRFNEAISVESNAVSVVSEIKETPFKTLNAVVIYGSTSASINNSLNGFKINVTINTGVNSTIPGNSVVPWIEDTSTSILIID